MAWQVPTSVTENTSMSSYCIKKAIVISFPWPDLIGLCILTSYDSLFNLVLSKYTCYLSVP